MTDKTATQNLTRAQASDDHKQLPVYLEILRDEVDARMTAHFYDLSRSQVPPLCRLSLGTPYSTSSDGNVRMAYDTVDVDTDDMADLSRDNRSIRLNSPGYYSIGAYVVVSPGSGPPTSAFTVGLAGAQNAGRQANDVGLVQLSISVGSFLQVTAPGVTFQTRRSAFGSTYAAWTFVAARMYAYKVRDL